MTLIRLKSKGEETAMETRKKRYSVLVNGKDILGRESVIAETIDNNRFEVDMDGK